jgi:hypothetical protein
MAGKLYISKGKFIRDGAEEKPEIGNAEQIRCLRLYEKFMEIMEEGEVIEINFPGTSCAHIWFRCICGENLYMHTNYLDEDCKDDAINNFDGKYLYCRKCSQRYELFKEFEIFRPQLRIKTI